MLKSTNKKNKNMSNQVEYFTAFDKQTPVSAAIFAPKVVIKQYSKLTKKIQQLTQEMNTPQPDESMINMIIVSCSRNGLIKIFRNESSYI